MVKGTGKGQKNTNVKSKVKHVVCKDKGKCMAKVRVKVTWR